MAEASSSLPGGLIPTPCAFAGLKGAAKAACLGEALRALCVPCTPDLDPHSRVLLRRRRRGDCAVAPAPLGAAVRTPCTKRELNRSRPMTDAESSCAGKMASCARLLISTRSSRVSAPARTSLGVLFGVSCSCVRIERERCGSEMKYTLKNFIAPFWSGTESIQELGHQGNLASA